MKKSILLIMIITVLSKFVGLFRDIALTYFYGASSVSDVYLIAQTIPGSLFSVIGAGLSTSFIPLYSRIQKEKGTKAADRFTSNVTNTVLLIVTFIVLLVMLVPVPIIGIYASGFEGEQLRMAVTFLRISIIGTYFTGVLYVFRSYLNLKNNFIVPAILGFPMNFVSVLSYYFASKHNDMILAYGIVFSILVQLALVLWSAVRIGYRYERFIDFKDPYLKEILLLAVPVFLGVSVNQIGVIVDKSIASSIVEGGISSLNYAKRLNGFIQGLFIAPIITVIYPNITKFIINGELDKLKKTVRESMVSISILVIPATVGAIVFARPIVELVFMRGQFDETAAEMTTVSLIYYTLGMLVSAIRSIFIRIFYAYQDTKTPMINSAITVAVDIVLNFVLVSFMGLGGLALSTSIGTFVSVGLMTRSLRKKIPDLGYREPLYKILKLLGASLFMSLVSYGLFSWLLGQFSQNLSLVISIFMGAFIYAGLVLWMNIEEVEQLKEFFLEKLKRVLQKKS